MQQHMWFKFLNTNLLTFISINSHDRVLKHGTGISTMANLTVKTGQHAIQNKEQLQFMCRIFTKQEHTTNIHLQHKLAEMRACYSTDYPGKNYYATAVKPLV